MLDRKRLAVQLSVPVQRPRRRSVVGIMDEGCHRVDRAPIATGSYAGAVDLRGWITAEHDGLRDRFARAVAANVPTGAVARHAPAPAARRSRGSCSTPRWHEDLAMQSAVIGTEPLLERVARRRSASPRPAPSAGLGEAEDRRPSPTRSTSRPCRPTPPPCTTRTARLAGDAPTSTALADVPPAGERIADLAGVTAADVPWLHAMWDGQPVGVVPAVGGDRASPGPPRRDGLGAVAPRPQPLLRSAARRRGTR